MAVLCLIFISILGIMAQQTCIRKNSKACHGTAFRLKAGRSVPSSQGAGFFPITSYKEIDWDGDGDPDRIHRLDGMYQENVGNRNFKVLQGSDNPLNKVRPPDAYVEAADWDGDGDVDLLVSTTRDGILYFERLDSGRLLQLRGSANPFYKIGLGRRFLPHVDDFDGDGDLDLLVEDQSVTGIAGVKEYWFYERYARDDLVEILFNNIEFEYPGRVAHHFFDWDGDGTLDCLLGLESGQVIYYPSCEAWNSDGPTPFETVSVDGFAQPWVVDWDGDNLNDLLVGSALGKIYYFKNMGERLELQAGSNDPFAGLDTVNMSAPQVVDLDQDGRKDLVVGSRAGALIWFWRTGTGDLVEPPTGIEPFRGLDAGDSERNFTVVRVEDWDGDSDLDLVVGYRVSGQRALGRVEVVDASGSILTQVELDSGDAPPFQVVDLDGDDDLDLVISSGGPVRIFLRGYCEIPNLCSGRGFCDKSSGTCTCKEGHVGPDCSGCERSHFYFSNSKKWSCKPCAGTSNNLTCSQRGVCMDDMNAQKKARQNGASNTVIQTIGGDGTCICTANFTGPDCSTGECGPGHHLAGPRKHIFYDSFQRHCEACPLGMAKSSPGNEQCSACILGQVPSKDNISCACPEGFATYDTQHGLATCQRCNYEGVVCSGHGLPVSKPGWFMVAPLRAERCSVEVGDLQSPCVGGYPFNVTENACLEGHTGPLCGACEVNYVRDGSDQKCVSCDNKPGIAALIMIVNLDAFLRACWAMFLAKRAIASTFSMKTDAVLLRISMHWMSVNWVLRNIDFSKVENFAWSSNNQVRYTTEDYLAFPGWFQTLCRTFMYSSGSMIRTLSAQEALECLVDKTWKNESSRRTARVLVPLLWWLLFPILILLWLAILVIFLAYIAWPMWIRFGGAADLYRVLVSYGVSKEDAHDCVASTKKRDIAKALRELERAARAKPDTCVLDPDTFSNLPIKRLLYKRFEAIRNSHPANYSQSVDASEYAKNVSHKTRSDPNVMSRVGDWIAESSGIASFALSKSARDQVLEWKDRPVPLYLMFGLFKCGALESLFKDALPIFLVGIYSIWSVVTQRLMESLSTRTIHGLSGAQIRSQRLWMKDTRLEFMKDDHLLVVVLASTGLVVWSAGIPLFLFFNLCRRRRRLQRFFALRAFGYFYNGLEPHYYWWEVIVKRLDVFCVYLVSYFEFASDVKAKLVLYGFIAAIFWVADLHARPFDDRQNRLLDRMDLSGMRVRFLTFLLLQLLFLFNATAQMNLIVACLLVIINGSFVVSISFVTLTEILSGLERTVELKRVRLKFTKIRSFSGCLTWLGISMMRFLAIFSSERSDLEKGVRHFQWVGVGKPILIRHAAKKQRRNIVQRLFRRILRRFFHLGGEKQAEYAASVAGKILEHLITHGSFENLSPFTLDFICTLPVALKRLTKDFASGSMSDHGPSAVVEALHEVYEEALNENARHVIKEATTNINDRSTFENVNDHNRMFSAEDLALALLYLYRLEPQAIQDLVKRSLKPLEANARDDRLYDMCNDSVDAPDIDEEASPLDVGSCQSNGAIIVGDTSIELNDSYIRDMQEFSTRCWLSLDLPPALDEFEEPYERSPVALDHVDHVDDIGTSETGPRRRITLVDTFMESTDTVAAEEWKKQIQLLEENLKAEQSRAADFKKKIRELEEELRRARSGLRDKSTPEHSGTDRKTALKDFQSTCRPARKGLGLPRPAR